MIRIKRKAVALIVCAVALLILVIWTLWANTALQVNEYVISSDELPQSFNGFRIAQVSDVHCIDAELEVSNIYETVEASEPDIIVFTGDVLESSKGIATAKELLSDLVDISPCYYVTGNHEGYTLESAYKEFEEYLGKIGITVLHDEAVQIEKNGEAITLAGIDDPDYVKNIRGGNGAVNSADSIRALLGEDSFSLLLSHRPELFDTYVEAGADLVLAGHAHGGQFRLPLIGGVIAPDQGLFPEYDGGVYTEGKTSMILSRGIGNSTVPIRFNNRPEVVLVVLENK